MHFVVHLIYLFCLEQLLKRDPDSDHYLQDSCRMHRWEPLGDLSELLMGLESGGTLQSGLNGPPTAVRWHQPFLHQ